MIYKGVIEISSALSNAEDIHRRRTDACSITASYS
jgi:hypothetical protein